MVNTTAEKGIIYCDLNEKGKAIFIITISLNLLMMIIKQSIMYAGLTIYLTAIFKKKNITI